MIWVNRLNGKPVLINADWIQSVEETPDTLITLTTGYKLLVTNSAKEIEDKFICYKNASPQFETNLEKRVKS